MSNSKEDSTWSLIAFRVLVNTASHPIEYAKVLIQIGHEPIPPYPTKTLFGKPALALPNVFQYVSYIKSVDGFTGCYRGLTPKLCANAVSGIVFNKVSDHLNFNEEDKPDEDDITEEERRWRYVQRLTRDIIARTAAIITSQPFTVIAVRMMAQFVGGETKYSGIFGSIRTIYQENGIGGFFSGVIPRILGDITSLAISTTLTFAINHYLVDDRDIRTYVSASMNFVASAVTYPFQLVSTCMAVTNSGLVAGKPPHMPIYSSWTDCWSHLSRTNQIKRGSSLIWRYYVGPQIVINGQKVALNKNNFIANGAM
ncbi:mitochondrial carrier homolog 2 [Anabrus simplex]|uniref:mitochondrial carrier homolog 2 n=1 Tax=Anabrus simplex TaxID=316456 RepID=UPI0034DD14E2